ncbi:MAG: mRNA interferase [uncultured Campylobacterales bacterium]|uniref:mRNA interferase n=1 Tax=uncultured Campylobacterales bacterium TaxID=352960 RepID=A0A6S6S084_9BACT|nr:MAG: mRNA interferase [uncultured Campylobacterales bacterium]
MFKKGNIHLARLNPRKGNEVGKIRPVLIYQTDLLNNISHPTTIVLPLSTTIAKNIYPLRYKINKRDNLKQDSAILCDQIRSIDNTRIMPDVVTTLSEEELLDIDKQVLLILDT